MSDQPPPPDRRVGGYLAAPHVPDERGARGTAAPRPHQIPFRTFLWDYLGHPDDETPERRRILYAIVVLRLGFGLLFLLRGWGAVFAAPPDAFAARLGDPARLGLSGAAIDTVLFIFGCTELGIGALLVVGAFTRVSAATGIVLLLASLLLGDRSHPALCARLRAANDGRCGTDRLWLPDVPTLITALLLLYVAGLLIILIAGSPFLSADRALDKLEEEERDRAPAVLPRLSERSASILRAGIAVAGTWLLAGRAPVAESPSFSPGALLIVALWVVTLVLVVYAPVFYLGVEGRIFWEVVRIGDTGLIAFAVPLLVIGVAYLLLSPPLGLIPPSRAATVKVEKT